MKRIASSLATVLSLLACGDDFDPQSAIVGVRVLGVRVDTPYAKPATQPKLDMLLVDGSPARGSRPVQIAWFHGCKNPDGLSFLRCYPELSRRLGEAYANRPAPIDREVPGLVTFGTTATADVPADTLSSRPETKDPIKQGRVYVFFAACGGQVTYDPSPPNSSGLPIRCVRPGTNDDLPAEEFVYGYTTIFVFDQITNANPIIDGVTFGGTAPPAATCDQGCPATTACGSRNRCLQIVPVCNDAKADTCPTYPMKPIVARASAELDPISSALDGKPTLESIYVSYAALNGRFENGTGLVNDLNRGWNEESEGKFQAWKSVPGEATLYAAVRDNRGGQAFVSVDVLIQ